MIEWIQKKDYLRYACSGTGRRRRLEVWRNNWRDKNNEFVLRGMPREKNKNSTGTGAARGTKGQYIGAGEARSVGV